MSYMFIYPYGSKHCVRRYGWIHRVYIYIYIPQNMLMAKVQFSSMLTRRQAMAPSYPSSWPAWEPSSGARGYPRLRDDLTVFDVGKIMPLAPFMTGNGL